MNSLISYLFLLPQKIFYNQSLEAAQVPEVDEGETEESDKVECVWSVHKVLEAVSLDIAGEENPHKEGRDVNDGVDSELDRILVCVREEVEDPGLVEHGVQLRHETEHAKALAQAGVDDPGDCGDGPDVVDSEEGELGGQDHVHGLCQVHPEAEQEAVGGQGRGAEQEVRAEAGGVPERDQRPGAREAGGDARQEGRPPLEHPHGARPHVLGDEGLDQGVPDDLDDWAEEKNEVEECVPLHSLHSIGQIKLRRGQHYRVVW